MFEVVKIDMNNCHNIQVPKLPKMLNISALHRTISHNNYSVNEMTNRTEVIFHFFFFLILFFCPFNSKGCTYLFKKIIILC